jgi:hypothetical protein
MLSKIENAQTSCCLTTLTPLAEGWEAPANRSVSVCRCET